MVFQVYFQFVAFSISSHNIYNFMPQIVFFSRELFYEFAYPSTRTTVWEYIYNIKRFNERIESPLVHFTYRLQFKEWFFFIKNNYRTAPK